MLVVVLARSLWSSVTEGFVARQPLPDRAGLLVRRQRLRRPTRRALQEADVGVTGGQVALELR